MLALTIREKNGEERQLIFEKEEVTIGRATGSDIVLPRSNISKRHARLVDKHDKVVIVDLRSTNGTYVNGRRITAPELLTYEDKVFIGDFVIRLSRPAEQHPSQRMTAPYSASPTPAEPRAARAATAAVDPVDPNEGGFEGDDSVEEVPAPRAKPAAPARHMPPSPPPMEVDEDESTRAISAMPDDDDEPPKKPVPAPLPPRKEVPPTPATAPAKREVPLPPPVAKVASAPVAPMPPPRPAPPPKPAMPTGKAPRPQPEEEVHTAVAQPVAPRKAPPPPPPPEPEPEPEPETLEAEAAPMGEGEAGEIDPWVEWNAAIQTVVERIEAAGEALPEDLDQAIADAVEAAVNDGEIAAETDRDALQADVTSELVGTGPIAELVADPTVRGLRLNGPKSLFVDRGAGVGEPNGRVFATARSYRRALAAWVGVPELEDIFGVDEHRLADGSVLRLVATGFGADLVAVWRRASIDTPLLPDLVAEGLLDDAQAAALTGAVLAGRNVLVIGPAGAARGALVSAIASEIGLDRRVLTVGDGSEVAIAQADQARIGMTSMSWAESVAALEPDLIVFEQLVADSVAPWVEVSLNAARPVVAAFGSTGEVVVDRALKRLGLALELGRRGSASGRGAAFIGEAVDLVVTLELDAQGTARVGKLYDIEGQKDGFAVRPAARR